MEEENGGTAEGGRSRPPSALERAAEWIVLGSVFVAPFLFGAVDTVVTLALAAVQCLALLLLAAGRTGRGPLVVGTLPWVLWVVIAGIAFQLLPLPPSLLGAIAPVTADVHGFIGGAPAWHPISLDPPATARELARALGLVAVVVVLRHRASTGRAGRGRALRLVAVAGAAVALVGVGHWAFGAEQLLGFHAYTRPPPLLTTFGNENHLAGFLNAAALVAIALAVEAAATPGRVAWASVALLCVAGSVRCESTAGRAALLVGLLVLVVARMRPVLDDGERQRPPGGILESWPVFVVACAIALVPLVAIQSGLSLRSFGQLVPDAFVRSKLEPARIAVSMARAQPLVGIGRGAFETVHPRFVFEPYRVSYTHVENEPLQAFSELGVLFGGLLVLATVGGALAAGRRGRASWPEAGAAAAAAALLLQNLADFSLHFAAGGTLALLLARAIPAPGRHGALGSVPGLVAGAVSLGLVPILAMRALPDAGESAAALASFAAVPTNTLEQVEAAANAAQARRPADAVPSQLAATRALQDPGGAKAALPWVNRLLYLSPRSGPAHVLAADTLARLGRKEQALLEYRVAGDLGVPTIPLILRRWTDRESILAAAPTVPDDAREAAKALEASGRREEAYEVLTRALDLDPHDLSTVDYLVHLSCRLGRSEKAVEASRRHRERYPGQEHAWVLDGQALECAGRPVDAQHVYAEGLERHSGSERIVIAWALQHQNNREPELVIRVLSRMTSAPAGEFRFVAYSMRANALWGLGKKEEARAEFQLALQFKPADVETRVALARLCVSLDRMNEAESYLASIRDTPAAMKLVDEIAARRARRNATIDPALLLVPGAGAIQGP